MSGGADYPYSESSDELDFDRLEKTAQYTAENYRDCCAMFRAGMISQGIMNAWRQAYLEFVFSDKF